MINSALLQQLWQQYATIRDTTQAPHTTQALDDTTDDVLRGDEKVATHDVLRCDNEDKTDDVLRGDNEDKTDDVLRGDEKVATDDVLRGDEKVATDDVLCGDEKVATDDVLRGDEHNDDEDKSDDVLCGDNEDDNQDDVLRGDEKVAALDIQLPTQSSPPQASKPPVQKTNRIAESVRSEKKRYVTHTDLEAHDKTGCLFMTCARQTTGYRFGCNSFASKDALATTSVLLTKGVLSGDQISIRSSLRIKQNLNGATGYHAVIRGPIYHLEEGVSFADGKKMVLLHAAKVLFRVYVKLISKLRVLFFENNLEDYAGQDFDASDEKTQDAILRQVARIPALTLQTSIISPTNMLQHACRLMEQMTTSLTDQSSGVTKTVVDHTTGQCLEQDGGDKADEGSDEPSLVGSDEASEDVSVHSSDEEEECVISDALEALQHPLATKRKRNDKLANEDSTCFFCNEFKATIVFPCGLHAACNKCMRSCWRSSSLVTGMQGVTCPYCRSPSTKRRQPSSTN